jgi:hypothetical protein
LSSFVIGANSSHEAPIKLISVASRLWKETLGMEEQPAEPASPRPNADAASSNPESDEMSATAANQEENRS